MKTATTTAAQLEEAGRRLDASYHASEGVRAHRFIREWAGQTTRPQVTAKGTTKERSQLYSRRRLDTLAEVCLPNGIFIPSRFKRIFVDDPAHGAPYLTGGSILQAEPLTGAKLLSYRHTANMEELALHERMILITCSGTIGNCVYVNANFKGAVGSPDLIRIMANPKNILSGYLYAWLSSPLARALIQQKTYGAVVPHIEAHHVVDLPVPRLDAATEQRIHELIERAAHLQTQANQLIVQSRLDLLARVGLPALQSTDYYFYGNIRLNREPGFFITSSSKISTLTINAWNHGDKFVLIRERIEAAGPHAELGSLLKPGGYHTGSWYKRIPGEPGRGQRLISQKQLFSLRKNGDWIATAPINNLEAELVTPGTTLIAGVGTMGESEVFGRCEFVWKNLEDKLVVAEVIRVEADPERINPGYLYCFLSTEYGFRLLRSTISGTKLCRFITALVLSLPVPLAPAKTQEAIGAEVSRAYELRAASLQLEDQAQALLTEALRTGELS